MKHQLQTLVLTALVASGGMLTAMADGPATSQVHRPFYGFFLSNEAFERLHYGWAETYFDTPDVSKLDFDYVPDRNNQGVYAGAGIDGIVYFCPYRFLSSMQAPEPMDMMTYNVFTNRFETIGAWNPENSDFKPTDMTYDYKNGKMYAVGFNLGNALYEVDINTGSFTKLCAIDDGVTIAASPAGELFTIGLDGVLYKLNPNTGGLTRIFDTGLTGMMSMQTMEFDRANGKLYWASNTTTRDSENAWLQEIDLSDLSNVTMTEVGRLGKNARFVSMYIPAADSFDAPAAPSDLTVNTVDAKDLSVSISWVNPTTTVSGQALPDGINGVVVFRNEEMIKLFPDAKAGEAMSLIDNEVPSSGEYRYDVMAFSGKGNGMKGTVFQYVGQDSPSAVNDIMVDVAADFMSAKITWEAPVKGAHDGVYIPADTKYNVIRRPDNVKVATGLTDTECTDTNFRRLLTYTYDIEAYNEQGSASATSGCYIMGPALTTPWEDNFEDNALIANRWLVLDANGDTYSWYVNTGLGHDIFGDYESAVEYILSPTTVDELLAESADDWLISAPIKFESGKQYHIAVSGRALSPEVLEVYSGPSADISEMRLAGEMEFELMPVDPNTGTAAFARHKLNLDTDGYEYGCIGLRLVTPVPFDYSAFMQIGKVEVREGDASGVSMVETDNSIVISYADSMLNVTGEFESGCVMTAGGVKVADIAGSSTSLDSLQEGVYVVCIITSEGVKTLKISK